MVYCGKPITKLITKTPQEVDENVTQGQRIVLASRPVGTPTKENFRIEPFELPELAHGDVALKTLYLSVDPYMRGRMSDAKSYVPPYELDKPILGEAIAEVTGSQSEQFQVGDIVTGQFGWQTHLVAKDTNVRKIDPSRGPITHALGLLGATGLTAYFGLIDICDPKPGETVVISGAAGAVGMVVGQIAKILGCHVVGIAGSDEKCRYLTEELHFDHAINYKTTEKMHHALSAACPNGIDVYFDNVGGSISDAVLRNINDYARISVCGQISLYNLNQVDVGPRIQTPILIHRAMMKGFIIFDYAPRFPEGIKQLATWLKEGKLTSKETIVEGFDHTIDAFLGLFSGENTGKQLVKL